MYEEEIEEDEFYEDDEEFDDEEVVESVHLKLPRPHAAQKKIIASKARFRILNCGRRWGKTLVAQIICINEMIAGKSVAYLTPEFSLGKEFFDTMLGYFPKAVIAKENKSDLQIKLKNGGRIRFFSGEACRNVRGLEFSLIVVDEAAHISDFEGAWWGAIYPTISRTQGKALIISTPNGTNFFYAMFKKGVDKEEGFESFHFASNTNPYFPKDEFEYIQRALPLAQFKQEYLAEPGSSQDCPWSQQTIDENTISSLSKKPTAVLGIDLASTTDYTVIIGLSEDGEMTYFDRFQLPWPDTMNRLKNLPPEIMKVVDGTGVGAVVFGVMQTEILNLHSFKFTGQSKPMIMQELIKDAEFGLLKWNKYTASEMKTFIYKQTSTGYIRYEAMSSFHDDAIMALALANHYRREAYSVANWRLYSL